MAIAVRDSECCNENKFMKIDRINLAVTVTNMRGVGVSVYIHTYAHAYVCNLFFDVRAVLFNTKALQISFLFCYCHLGFWVPVRWAECSFLKASTTPVASFCFREVIIVDHKGKRVDAGRIHPCNVSAQAFRTAGSCCLQFVCETSSFVVCCLSHWKGCVCMFHCCYRKLTQWCSMLSLISQLYSRCN